MGQNQNGNGKRPPGRPSVWEDPRVEGVVLRAFGLNMTIAEAAGLAGIGEKTIDRRLASDPEFKANVAKAKAATNELALQGIVDDFNCAHSPTALHAKTWWAERMVPGVKNNRLDVHVHPPAPELAGVPDDRLALIEDALAGELTDEEATTNGEGSG